MQEWFNWHAWKACVPQKGTGGSNPPLSAKLKCPVRQLADGVIYFTEDPLKACFHKGLKVKLIDPRSGAFKLCMDTSKGITTERSEVVIP
jgi:hypothetical protein